MTIPLGFPFRLKEPTPITVNCSDQAVVSMAYAHLLSFPLREDSLPKETRIAASCKEIATSSNGQSLNMDCNNLILPFPTDSILELFAEYLKSNGQ